MNVKLVACYIPTGHSETFVSIIDLLFKLCSEDMDITQLAGFSVYSVNVLQISYLLKVF